MSESQHRKIKYILESWNPKTRKYVKLTDWKGEGYGKERAYIAYNKSYNQRHTQRLVRIETTIIAQHSKRKAEYVRITT